MASCSDTIDQTRDIRIAHPNYSERRFEADYVVTVSHWQSQLNCGGFYSGPADGRWGPSSRRGVQLMMREYQYFGPVDGDWGVNTWKAIQRFARANGGYSGVIDGEPGRLTWEGIFYSVVPVA